MHIAPTGEPSKGLWRFCDSCSLRTRTAENSERTANIPLFFRLHNWRRPRISAGDRRSIAVNFREKQRKQRRGALRHVTPRAAEVHPNECVWILSRRFFDVPAKLVAHRRQQLVGEIRFSARSEPVVKSCREDMRRDRLVDGGLDRPPALARIRHPAGKPCELGILGES